MSRYASVKPGMGQYRIDIGPANQSQYRLPPGGFLERVEMVMFEPILFESMSGAYLTAYLEAYGQRLAFDRIFGFYTNAVVSP